MYDTLRADDVRSVKLTVDRVGRVWFLDGESFPQCSELSIRDFFKSAVARKRKRFRVVGLGDNAELILTLFSLRGRKLIESVQVCSPLCCPDPTERNDPESLLFSMRCFHRSSSLGGWHEFSEAEVVSYSLAALDRRGALDHDTAVKILKKHSAWDSWSFVNGLDVLSLGCLVARILDPRWFVDDRKPSGKDRLEQYLGLTKKIAIQVCDGAPLVGARKLFDLVRRCWKNKLDQKDNRRGGTFVWKTWVDRGGGWRGDLLASRRFIRFIYLTWMDSLSARRGRIFVPKFFFQNDGEELNRYLRHLGSLNSK